MKVETGDPVTGILLCVVFRPCQLESLGARTLVDDNHAGTMLLSPLEPIDGAVAADTAALF